MTHYNDIRHWRYIFSQGYSLYFFLFFAHLWWFGSWTGFLGLVFSVDGVSGLRCGAFRVFLGYSSLYKHRRITLGKDMCELNHKLQVMKL